MDFPTSRLLYPYNHDYQLYLIMPFEGDLQTPFKKSQGHGRQSHGGQSHGGQKPQLTDPTEPTEALDRSHGHAVLMYSLS